MDTNELLEKVLTTTTLGGGGGGVLNPAQASRFIDYMWDEAAITKVARKVKMKEPVADIDKVAVGQRLTRKATEATDDGSNADPTFTKVSLSTVKVRLDWELSTEALEDNIEGEALEDHVARLMATQMGNDLEDLYINGDTTNAGDALLKSSDGFLKLLAAGAHVVSAGGAGLNKSVFNKVVKTMPRKYLSRRGDLRFFTSPGLLQDFLNTTTGATAGAFLNIAERAFENPGGVQGDAGGSINLRPFGVIPSEVPLIPEDANGSYSGATGDHGSGFWTFPNNLIIGVQREIKIYREYKPKKDTIEYTVYARVANAIENLDAAVLVTDIKVDDAAIS